MLNELLSRENDLSSMRFAFLFLTVGINGIFWILWLALSIKSGKMEEVGAGLGTVYLAVNGASILGNVCQRLVESLYPQKGNEVDVQ